jgi:predicted Ser/Thr protein kinase
MEKLEISIPYAAAGKQVSKRLCAAWILAGLVLIGVLIMIYLSLHLGRFALLGILILIWSIYLIYVVVAYAFFQMTLAISPQKQILITTEGIGLPRDWLGLYLPKWCPWSTIRNLQLEQHKDSDAILFRLKNNAIVRLDPKRLSKTDLEQLLLGVEAFGKTIAWQQQLSDYRDQLQNENRGIKGISYTKLWQDELARCFNPTTFAPLAPGKHLRSGSLTIKLQLSFGGFSAVYLAEDTAIGEVVVKELATPMNLVDKAHSKAVELFEREAQLLSKLKHPRIVGVLDHFVEDSRHYIVLERIDGKNLRQLVMQKGALKENEVIILGRQMAQILCYLHGLEPPLIHRDLTPDNLVLRKDKGLVVVDFGAANEFLGSATGTLVGKQFYMPPEQIKGKTQPASDIFAMGCTLHFLLTGHDPKALTTSSPRRLNNHVSTDLDELVTQMTALDLSERQIDASGVLEELNRIGKKVSACKTKDLANLDPRLSN